MNAFSTPREVSAGVVLDNYMSIYAAAEYSGYNPQYFRRLMRRGDIEGIKVGQVWLVKIDSPSAHAIRIHVTLSMRDAQALMMGWGLSTGG
jgi:hypothetical protein